MAVFKSIVSLLKSWRMVGLLALVAGVASLGYGASTLWGASEPPLSVGLGAAIEGLGQGQAQPSEIVVKGRLVFPRQQDLTFATPGEVGEVLVQEGERVQEGQALARLDRTAIIGLEESVAQLKLDRLRIRETQDRAQKKFDISPLEGARFDDEVAKARKGLKDALEQLDDFQRTHQQKVADATRAKADGEFALFGTMQANGSGQPNVQSGSESQGSSRKSSMEALSDFDSDYQRQLTEVRLRKAEAQLAADEAEEAANGFGVDYRRLLASLQKKRAEAESLLDRAVESLASFDIEYGGELDRAKVRVGRAEEASVRADAALTAFIRTSRHAFLSDLRIEHESDEEAILDSPSDVFRRLRDNVEEAKTHLAQAREDFFYLQGNRSLMLTERQTRVAEAEAALAQADKGLVNLAGNRVLQARARDAEFEAALVALAQAEDDLADLEKEPDSFLLRSLQAAVETDRATLAQAEIDLARLLEGPNPEDLAVLQQGVANWRAALQDLFEVDSLEVALLEAQDDTAKARLEDLMNDLQGAALRAPFAGIVSLVNVEVDDHVSDESWVLTLVDPTIVVVTGLVDATQARFVEEGADASIVIASLPSETLAGVVSSVAGEPRTERGVVSYAVTIQVDLPPGVEAPLSPTLVSVLVETATAN